MEYCSPLWAGAPTSHLSRLHAAEIKAFRIIGFSRDEAESLGLSLSHSRQVIDVSVFYCLSGLTPLLCLPSVLPIFPQDAQSPPAKPLLVKLPKSRITAHLHSPLLFLPLEQTPTLSSIPFFPTGLQNSCSPPLIIVPHPNL